MQIIHIHISVEAPGVSQLHAHKTLLYAHVKLNRTSVPPTKRLCTSAPVYVRSGWVEACGVSERHAGG